MAKTRQQKKKILKDLEEKVAQSKAMVFVNFDGLTVDEAEEFRAKCLKHNVGYMVAKKTLLKLAMQKHGIDVDPKTFERGIAAVFGFEDIGTAAKITYEFSKDHPNLKTVAGILEKKLVSEKIVEELSRLPSIKELYAKVVFSLNAPIVGLVNVLSENLRGLVQVLRAIGEKKT